jgi:hypothetical protein
MHRNTWKRGEERLASFFGSTRRPLSGGNDKRGRDDSLHPRLFIESKHGKQQMMWNLYLQTRKLAEEEGRTPVIGLHKSRYKGFLLVIHQSDLEAIFRERCRALGVSITLSPKKRRPLRTLR